MIRSVDPAEAAALAALHAEVFDRPWDAATFRELLLSPGVLARADAAPTGFILIRVVAEEAEILTLAVSSSSRRRGLGRRLVETAAAEAAVRGAETLFLEVAADNGPAIALYGNTGFETAGRRTAYYARTSGAAVDALVLKRTLDRPLRRPA